MQLRFVLTNGTVKTVPYEDIDKHNRPFRFLVGNGLDRSAIEVVAKEERYRVNGTVKTVPYEDIDKHSSVFRFL